MEATEYMRTVIAEVTEQWGGTDAVSTEQLMLASDMATVAYIARMELARPVRPEEQTALNDVAAKHRIRSRKPRTVLRALVELAHDKFDWQLTEKVRAAAGIRAVRA